MRSSDFPFDGVSALALNEVAARWEKSAANIKSYYPRYVVVKFNDDGTADLLHTDFASVERLRIRGIGYDDETWIFDVSSLISNKITSKSRGEDVSIISDGGVLKLNSRTAGYEQIRCAVRFENGDRIQRDIAKSLTIAFAEDYTPDGHHYKCVGYSLVDAASARIIANTAHTVRQRATARDAHYVRTPRVAPCAVSWSPADGAVRLHSPDANSDGAPMLTIKADKRSGALGAVGTDARRLEQILLTAVATGFTGVRIGQAANGVNDGNLIYVGSENGAYSAVLVGARSSYIDDAQSWCETHDTPEKSESKEMCGVASDAAETSEPVSNVSGDCVGHGLEKIEHSDGGYDLAAGDTVIASVKPVRFIGGNAGDASGSEPVTFDKADLETPEQMAEDPDISDLSGEYEKGYDVVDAPEPESAAKPEKAVPEKAVPGTGKPGNMPESLAAAIERLETAGVNVTVATVAYGTNTCPELEAAGVKPKRYGKLHHRYAYVAFKSGSVVVALKASYAPGFDIESEKRLNNALEAFYLK